MKKKDESITNARRASQDHDFKVLCSKTGVPATKRQASKFARGMGIVYRTQILHHKDVPLPGENKKRR
jgi:hypothetical protein